LSSGKGKTILIKQIIKNWVASAKETDIIRGDNTNWLNIKVH
jgi:hypothetical protein